MEKEINTIDSYNIASYNKTIAWLYRNAPSLKSMDFANRVQHISAIFLGRPYLLGAAGEGHEGRFDQAPLYRFDAFDCVTYVNSILALALSHDVVSFRKNLIRIAYRGAQLDYSHRHHFMSVDWNVHNQSIGLVKDITSEIVDKKGNPIYKNAETMIDRPNWFRHRSYEDIRLLQKITEDEMDNLLSEMRAIGEQVSSQENSLPYLPLSEMFDAEANPKNSIFLQIPHGSIIEVVRPNWNLKDKIGTNLNVSHVGFAIWHGNILYYRQASSIEKRVFDIPMIEYLKYRLVSPTVKGINVQRLL